MPCCLVEFGNVVSIQASPLGLSTIPIKAVYIGALLLRLIVYTQDTVLK